jgi:hypothetical protein
LQSDLKRFTTPRIFWIISCKLYNVINSILSKIFAILHEISHLLVYILLPL